MRKWIKTRVEKLLGVSITRTPYVWNQKSDGAVRALRDWSSDDVVFDIGANDGRTLLRIAAQLRMPRIFAFEPVAETYGLLVSRTAALSNVRCFQVALGAEAGRRKIHVSRIGEMSSLREDWDPSPSLRTETVQVKTIDQIMNELGIDFIHFLKIDTEGYDLEVLHGARRALAESRVALLQVEAGFAQAQKQFATLEQMRIFLAPRGYRLFGVFTQARAKAKAPPHWPDREVQRLRPEVLVYCDALFVRAELVEQRHGRIA